MIGLKNYSDGAIWPRKKCDDIFSHLDTIHEYDGQTDGQTDTGQQQYRAYAYRRAVKSVL